MKLNEWRVPVILTATFIGSLALIASLGKHSSQPGCPDLDLVFLANWKKFHSPRADLWTDIRLPGHTRPLHYDITVDTNIDQFEFSGQVVVKLNISKATKIIVMHAVDLELSGARLFSLDKPGSVIQSTRNETNVGREQFSLKYGRPVYPGLYRLEMRYWGYLFLVKLPSISCWLDSSPTRSRDSIIASTKETATLQNTLLQLNLNLPTLEEHFL